jgi:hypothetical protein
MAICIQQAPHRRGPAGWPPPALRESQNQAGSPHTARVRLHCCPASNTQHADMYSPVFDRQHHHLPNAMQPPAATTSGKEHPTTDLVPEQCRHSSIWGKAKLAHPQQLLLLTNHPHPHWHTLDAHWHTGNTAPSLSACLLVLTGILAWKSRLPFIPSNSINDIEWFI